MQDFMRYEYPAKNFVVDDDDNPALRERRRRKHESTVTWLRCVAVLETVTKLTAKKTSGDG
jgi:hypothetical protein